MWNAEGALSVMRDLSSDLLMDGEGGVDSPPSGQMSGSSPLARVSECQFVVILLVFTAESDRGYE